MTVRENVFKWSRRMIRASLDKRLQETQKNFFIKTN